MKYTTTQLELMIFLIFSKFYTVRYVIEFFSQFTNHGNIRGSLFFNLSGIPTSKVIVRSFVGQTDIINRSNKMLIMRVFVDGSIFFKKNTFLVDNTCSVSIGDIVNSLGFSDETI